MQPTPELNVVDAEDDWDAIDGETGSARNGQNNSKNEVGDADDLIEQGRVAGNPQTLVAI
jgi:hypothetical protein